MGYWSYKKSNIEYRDNKHTPIIEDERKRFPKKKQKKKVKRANHKHEYVPAIYTHYYTDFNGKRKQSMACGDHCKICGRVRNFGLNWYTNNEDRISLFKKQYPDYVEIELPENWSYFKNKYIPI